MKIAVICFSLTGWQTGERLLKGLAKAGVQATLDGKSRYLADSMEGSIKAWTKERFADSDGIVFIGACGIAVRHIAPYVVGKKTDPAVLVIDECGKFVISLLSGHLGGANELAEKAAEILGATPVITTATDLHSRFAVDVFAKKNDCAIFHMKAAKEVSAAILAGEEAGFYSEFPWEGELPQGLTLCSEEGVSKNQCRPRVGVAVTVHRNTLPFEETVQVVPKVISLGMGCRKGKDPEAVCAAAEQCFQRAELYPEAAANLASIDLKKEEEGLLEVSRRWNIPFVTYSTEELLAVPGTFTPSSFVRQVTGVDNVCERSAVLASGLGALTEKKYGADGVTAAAAIKNWRIRFE